MLTSVWGIPKGLIPVRVSFFRPDCFSWFSPDVALRHFPSLPFPFLPLRLFEIAYQRLGHPVAADLGRFPSERLQGLSRHRVARPVCVCACVCARFSFPRPEHRRPRATRRLSASMRSPDVCLRQLPCPCPCPPPTLVTWRR